MTKIVSLLTLLTAALGCSAFVQTANSAARDRVFVASYGNDNNPCTFGSPCKTFQHAHDVVATSGEITAIDSAGFGPIVITKGVTVTSPPGVEAGIVAGAVGAIVVNATSNDAVVLRGLTLEGANFSSYGITVNSAGKIEIIDCVVRDFSQTGILMDPSSPMNGLISNTSVLNNAGNGIHIDYEGYPPIQMTLSHLTVADNNGHGIEIENEVYATISHSVFGSNGAGTGCDISVTGAAGENPYVYYRDLMMNNNANNTCSVGLNGQQNSYFSEVFGGRVLLSGTQNVQFTDGTNELTFSLSQPATMSPRD